jgi:hypothetical protein
MRQGRIRIRDRNNNCYSWIDQSEMTQEKFLNQQGKLKLDEEMWRVNFHTHDTIMLLKVVFNFMLPLITGLNCLLGNDKSDASGVYHRVCQSNCRWWMPRREIPGWTSLVPFHNLFQVPFPWYSRVEQPFIFYLDKILHLVTKWSSVLHL